MNFLPKKRTFDGSMLSFQMVRFQSNLVFQSGIWPIQFFANYQVGKEEKKNETMSQSEENV